MNKELDPCTVCQGPLKNETITYTQVIGDRVHVVTDVPAEVCEICGEQYLSPDTVDVIQEAIERGSAPKTMVVPVHRFPHAAA
jgi:YgiT-type zinc finger domain-containing protein